MSVATDIGSVEKIAAVVGVGPALKLCGFFGNLGKNLHVPASAKPGHIIAKVIGEDAFAELVKAFGDSALWVPKIELEPLRRAGMAYTLRRRGLPDSLIASACGCSRARIQQLSTELTLAGFDPSILSDDVEAE